MVHWRSADGPLTVHLRSANVPLTVHWRSANGPLTVRQRSANIPLTVRWWSTDGPLTVRWRSEPFRPGGQRCGGNRSTISVHLCGCSRISPLSNEVDQLFWIGSDPFRSVGHRVNARNNKLARRRAFISRFMTCLGNAGCSRNVTYPNLIQPNLISLKPFENIT